MEFDSPELINEEAIEALTPEQIEQALAILTKAGYQTKFPKHLYW